MDTSQLWLSFWPLPYIRVAVSVVWNNNLRRTEEIGSEDI